jgi:Leucine Rich repeat
MLIHGSDTTTESQLLMKLWTARQDPECDSLVLKEVDFNVNIVSAFIETLQSKASWKSIKVHECVGGAIVYDVLWAICTLPHIQSFELDHSISSVGSPAFAAMAYALNYSNSLKSLTVRARTIDVEAGNNLARGIARNTCLDCLDLGGSVWASPAIGPLSFGLRLNRSLHTLKLDGCQLDDANMATILQALQDHPNLKVLSITQNQCHDEGMGAIAALLHYNQLEELNMSYLVRIKKDVVPPTPEVPEVAEAEPDAEKEEENTDVDEKQAASKQGGENEDQSTNANENNGTPNEEKSQEKSELEEANDQRKVCNTHLKRFAMAGNYISDAFVESLLGVFGRDCALEELNLFGNRITDHGLALIVRKIPQFRKLRTLWLGQNPFYPAAAEGLLEMMKTNYTIMDVSVRCFEDSQMDKIQEQLDHYCRLNRGGRRILASPTSTIPLSLWPLLMERTQRVFGGDSDRDVSVTNIHSHSVDALYCLLRGPAIFENPRIMEAS